MASPDWHEYFDSNDASNWSIYGFHEEWIRQYKGDPKKLRYQKANDVITKSLRSLINDCEDEVKKQLAAKLIANRVKRGYGNDVDKLWASIEKEQLARTKLNCEQVDNVAKFSSALTDAAVNNLTSIMSESTISKRPIEFLNSETASPEGARTPPSSSPPNKDIFTPNKRDMHNEKVVRYLDVMGSSLNYNRVLYCAPPVWTEPIQMYLNNAFKREGDEFKTAIMQKIEGDERNYFRLYCEKILIDFYNLVDIFPNMSRKIGERKYIVQNISSLFKFYETTFGKVSFDWIESHSPAGKLTKSATNSGIIKVDVRGVRLLDDKEIIHVEVSGPPSSPTERHTTGDTKKSLHTDILNLISILLDHLDLSVEVATKIKVYSIQVIEYRITLYSLNMMNDGSFLASELFSAVFPFSFDGRAKYKQILLLMGIFHNEVTNQISLMQELDLEIDVHGEKSVRDVLKIPSALKELLQK